MARCSLKNFINLGTLVPVITVLFFRLPFGDADRSEAQKGLESITAREISAHIEFLASDLLEGRGNGDRGLEIAAEYIAAQFEDAGVEPAGDNGTYFQEFGLVHKKLSEPNILQLKTRERTSTRSTAFEFGQDFIPFGFTANKKVVASIIFVGYGITAPEYRYDDYKGVDVEGKVVLMFRHEPQERDSSSVFNGRGFTNHSGFRRKARNAQQHGAAGMILVTDPLNHESYNVTPIDQAWPENPPARKKFLFLSGPENALEIAAVHVTMDVANDLLAGTGKELKEIQETIDDKFQPNSFAITNKTVLLQTSVSTELIKVRNVVGKIEGSSSETIVIGAHYDHDGKDGEAIYNGADDNASGVTGLLEIAEAFMANNNKPKRTLLFIAFAAEEKELLGSEYYVSHPVIPWDSTVAMIAMDMIGRNEDTASMSEQSRAGFPVVTAEESENSLYVIGTTFSKDMKKITDEANQGIGFDLRYGYDNVQNSVRRSDSWSFLDKGIPALYYSTGLHPDYHRPSDTSDKINTAKTEKVIKLVYLTSWNLANIPEKPKYEPPGTVKD